MYTLDDVWHIIQMYTLDDVWHIIQMYTLGDEPTNNGSGAHHQVPPKLHEQLSLY